MKTTLPESISTQEEAEKFLSELFENNEHYHPEDSAKDQIYLKTGERVFNDEDAEKLDKLMSDIYMLSGGDHANPIFDPCEYLLEMEEEEERRNKLSRPTEY